MDLPDYDTRGTHLPCNATVQVWSTWSRRALRSDCLQALNSEGPQKHSEAWTCSQAWRWDRPEGLRHRKHSEARSEARRWARYLGIAHACAF